MEIRIMPIPSAREWWIFCTMAERPPSTPSRTTNSHSGRARSNPAMAKGPA